MLPIKNSKYQALLHSYLYIYIYNTCIYIYIYIYMHACMYVILAEKMILNS